MLPTSSPSTKREGDEARALGSSRRCSAPACSPDIATPRTTGRPAPSYKRQTPGGARAAGTPPPPRPAPPLRETTAPPLREIWPRPASRPRPASPSPFVRPRSLAPPPSRVTSGPRAERRVVTWRRWRLLQQCTGCHGSATFPLGLLSSLLTQITFYEGLLRKIMAREGKVLRFFM